MSRTPKMDQYSFYSHYRAMGMAGEFIAALWKDYETSYDSVEVETTGLVDMADPERNDVELFLMKMGHVKNG